MRVMTIWRRDVFKRKRRCGYSRWLAWYPVELWNEPRWVWLEFVWLKRVQGGDDLWPWRDSVHYYRKHPRED